VICPEPTQARLIVDAAIAALSAVGGVMGLAGGLNGAVDLIRTRSRSYAVESIGIGVIRGLGLGLLFALYVFKIYL
jgi:hypothetical protein